MIPLVAPNFFRHTPDVLHPLLESAILLTAIDSVALNLFFNGLAKTEAAYVTRDQEVRRSGISESGIKNQLIPDTRSRIPVRTIAPAR
jgi:hypothetical protein